MSSPPPVAAVFLDRCSPPWMDKEEASTLMAPGEQSGNTGQLTRMNQMYVKSIRCTFPCAAKDKQINVSEILLTHGSIGVMCKVK